MPQKSVMIFLGSARRGGNTEILCNESAKGVASTGVKPELIRLSSIKILPCRGCFKCFDGTLCRTNHNDDINGILERMINCRGFIFASPVYFWNVSGIMKMFFDRLLPLISFEKKDGSIEVKSCVEGKNTGIILVQEEKNGVGESIPEKFFRLNFKDFKLNLVGILRAKGLLEKGDAKKRRSYLNQAQLIGRRVAG